MKAGQTVAGRYRLERKLGSGGMGEVWAATQTVTRKPVALKFLRDQDAEPDMKRRFLREARAACAVRHPNVVEIHDVLEMEGGSPVMVMELLEGESLEQRLRREVKMSLGDLSAVMLRVVAAVGTAHAAGIVHRDLKPDNIFLAQTPEGVEVKVLDFGIAKLTALEGDAAQTGGLTSTGAMLGTPHYMSPEQAFGEKKIDHRADIWSLGIILYRGLTGILPTRADNIGQILKIVMTNAIPPLGEVAPQLPPDIAELVGSMLQQDPKKRPADLREVKTVLERCAGMRVEGFDAPVSVAHDSASGNLSGGAAPSLGASAKTPSPVGSRSFTKPLAALLALALGGGAAFVAFRAQGRRGGAPPADRDAGASAAASPNLSVPPAPSSEEPPPTAQASAEPSAEPQASATPEGSSKPKAKAPVVPGSAKAPASAKPEATADPAKTSVGGVIVKPPF